VDGKVSLCLLLCALFIHILTPIQGRWDWQFHVGMGRVQHHASSSHQHKARTQRN
jgi:hypothetical protein